MQIKLSVSRHHTPTTSDITPNTIIELDTNHITGQYPPKPILLPAQKIAIITQILKVTMATQESIVCMCVCVRACVCA